VSFANKLRAFLRCDGDEYGFSDSEINAAWPNWWSDEAEASTSCRAELCFHVARQLKIDPRFLIAMVNPA
jgi:hypothetical protein